MAPRDVNVMNGTSTSECQMSMCNVMAAQRDVDVYVKAGRRQTAKFAHMLIRTKHVAEHGRVTREDSPGLPWGASDGYSTFCSVKNGHTLLMGTTADFITANARDILLMKSSLPVFTLAHHGRRGESQW